MNKIIVFILFITILWSGCEPSELDREGAGTLPDESQLSFTIAQGPNDFKYVVKNTSSVSGIAKWTFGNGRTGSGDVDTAYYPEQGTFTITMTLYTKAGSVVKTQSVTTTKTDWEYFNDPDNTLLSGGTEALYGKTWVLDSLSQGHIGVGQEGSDGLGYWSAPPLDKKGFGLYDDRLNFSIIGFKATLTNNGKSFVKKFRGTDPAYTNPVDAGGDLTVDFTPEPGRWAIQKKGTDKYLVLSGNKPIFPTFDVGAKNGEYKIISLETNKLVLVATGGDNNAWHYQLIPEGYVKPTFKYNLTITPTANANEYQMALTNVDLPAGMSVSNVKWTLGDGTEKTEAGISTTITHTYMRKGPYAVNVTVNTSAEAVAKSATVTVSQNHPDYVPYLLDAMVMYQDFGESSYAAIGFDKSGGDGSLVTVTNPDATRYPNRSAKAGKYTKINTEWANAFLKLNAGYRFNLTKQTAFKLLVYGKAGDVVLLKLENTDRGGNAWQTGAELRYTIKATNTWEIATFDFKGVSAGSNSTGDIYTTDITTDPRFNSDFYDVIRIMYNPGDASATYTFYFDDLAGPHAEGI